MTENCELTDYELTYMSKSIDDLQPSSNDLLVLVRANATFQSRHGSPQQAAVMLEELRK